MSSSRKTVAAVAAVAGSLLAGVVVAWNADAYLPTLLGVLLVAPALVCSATLALVAIAFRRRALALLAVVPAAFAAPAFFLPQPISGAWPDPPVLGCGAVGPPSRPIIVATFNTHAKTTEAEAERLAPALAKADIVVMQEVGSKKFVKALADELGGDGIFSVTMGKYGQAIVVRNGAIPRCFGVQRYRKVPLPAARKRRASAVVAYARFQDGIVPIVSFHNDRPGSLADLPDWPDDLGGSATTLATVASELPASVIVAGDSNTTPHFRHFNSLLGLDRAPPRRSWPQQLPLVALDGVWHGPHWAGTETWTARPPVESDHRIVWAVLSPR